MELSSPRGAELAVQVALHQRVGEAEPGGVTGNFDQYPASDGDLDRVEG